MSQIEEQRPSGDEPVLVTEVRIQLTKRPPILAYVSITLWGSLAVHDLRILQRNDGSQVVLMPRVQGSDGSWSTIAHPVRETVRAEIERKVMRAFSCAEAERDDTTLGLNGTGPAEVPPKPTRTEPARVGEV